MTVREFFKKIVKDAKENRDPFDQSRPVMSYGSQRASWFERTSKKEGKYYHLTDEYIDSISIDKLEATMILFIADCFRQR